MPRDLFEIDVQDGAARSGQLTIPGRDLTVETPALLPVVNPHRQTVTPARLESTFGAEILITNAYILYGSDEFRERALDEGLHRLYEFDGAIMTDSGSFQLAEYGSLSVETTEILEFQRRIGSDIATPVDIPTPPDAPRERAETDLATTERALADAEAFDADGMLLNGPLQGSTYADLRRRAATQAYTRGFDIYPVGAMVPLLSAYRYADIVEMVLAAKQGLGTDAPVHLFGAGHPMMFALAVALGCDLFDSAAYALYARDARYLTVSGTERLAELSHLPCSCPICVATTPAELRAHEPTDRTRMLAEHNLYVSYEEMRRIKLAIRQGNLFELLEVRARGHPALLDAYRCLLDHETVLESSDPATKGSFFQLSAESSRRPEVRRHQDRLSRLAVPGDSCLLTAGSGHSDTHDSTWRLLPPFGPFPRALSEVYPLVAETPERLSLAAYESAADGVTRLVEANPEVRFSLAHHRWPAAALDRLPESIEILTHESPDDEP